MIDFLTYRKLHPEASKLHKSGRRKQNDEAELEEFDKELLLLEKPPDDESIFLFPSVVMGYNLRLKKWGSFCSQI